MGNSDSLDSKVSSGPYRTSAREERVGSGLVVTVGNGIYCVEECGKYRMERSAQVLALAPHGSRVYDGGMYRGIFDTLSGEMVARRTYAVNALVSHEGRLYDSCCSAVFDTFSSEIIARRDHRIHTLVSHGGSLYDCGDYHAVFNTLSGEEVARRHNKVLMLVSHNGRLCDAGAYGAVFDTLGDKEVTRRTWFSSVVVSHEGGLYAADKHGAIFDTLHDPKGKNPLWRFDGKVTAMASVPLPLWEELARKGTLVRD